jgi:hypothetical protein
MALLSGAQYKVGCVSQLQRYPLEANNTLHPAFAARGLRSLQRGRHPIPVQAMTNRR